MVDATAGFLSSRAGQQRAPNASHSFSGATGARDVVDAATLDAYATLADRAVCAPAQSSEWVAGWMGMSGVDPLLVFVDGAHGARLALPLEIVRKGPFRVARFMGGRHANGNLPAASATAGSGPAGHGIDVPAIARTVRVLRPDVDLVHLERMADELSGAVNPLAHLPRTQSPNIALSVDLSGGFDALLERVSGKRKRKKHRAQTRKFEAAGGVRRIEASTAQEVDRLFDAFLSMKSERFRKMGIADVFADFDIQAFWRGLFIGALDGTPRQFVLHGLEVGGELRAVTGSSRVGDRMICEFGAISEDELAPASPGEFLFFEDIRAACEAGHAVYDFSVGDEPYKRLWCNIESTHFDVAIPTTLKGRGLAALIGLESRLKRVVKRNRALWAMLKTLRRRRRAAQVGSRTDQESD